MLEELLRVILNGYKILKITYGKNLNYMKNLSM